MSILVIIEGSDVSATTKVARALARNLSKEKVPLFCPLSPQSDFQSPITACSTKLTIVSDAASLALRVGDDIDFIDRAVRPALNRGQVVITDRYWWTYRTNRQLEILPELKEALLAASRTAWNSIQPTVLFVVESPKRKPVVEGDQRRDSYLRAAHESHAVSVLRVPKSTVAAVAKHCTRVLLDLLDVRRPRASNKKKLSLTHPAQSTVVYDTYWRFATERQRVFMRRVNGEEHPWTHDPILSEFKFTNAYRASDRVSQYLIRNVIYSGDYRSDDLLFRILLFKVFNRIGTWELLEKAFGEILYRDFSYKRYDAVLSRAMEKGATVYSAAYIMPSGSNVFANTKRKHQMHLMLIDKMLQDELHKQLADTRRMRDGFELLRSYPTLGDFLAYQYITDINYSTITDYSEAEFVVPGPGAYSGIHKCFSSLGGLSEVDIIKFVTDNQEREFESRGLHFEKLWGRPLQLIDCQNLFCEVDKYSRIFHPDIRGASNRKKIKQRYRMNVEPINYWFPPKWKINERIVHPPVKSLYRTLF